MKLLVCLKESARLHERHGDSAIGSDSDDVEALRVKERDSGQDAAVRSVAVTCRV